SARPAGGSSRSESGRGDNRQGSRNAGKNRKDKPQIKGSYATKESRPNRSAGHQMPVNRNRKPTNAPKAPAAPVEIVRPTYVEVGESINVQEFAKLIKREVNEVIKALFMLGMMVTINQDIDFDTAQLIGDNFGVEVGQKAPEEDPTEIPEVEDPPEKRLPRPPVITVMGHVDHGKTSLLDAIRKTNVTAREAGGITQHIGAYKVNYQGKQIVFLDTPGHEAFTAMRARGAQVTDVAILVVAADDGVMPQTIEAINHAKAAKVPIIVAINKMDRPGANPDHVKQQLAEHELIPEDWGGDTIMVPVSAHQKTGITDLLEMILLVAEMQELKANPNLPAHGTIIEAQLDKGRGPVATVLVQRGTLHIGDTIIAGTSYGKVRAMINDRGEKVKKALPSTPVEVLGLNDVPQAGDILDSTDEKIARSVAEKRIAKKKEEEIKLNAKVSLDDLFQRIQEGELKELDIVVKADVQGTIEALKASLEKIKNDEVKVVVVHAGVGAITESDVMLASAANALIIGFNVRPDANARKAAETEKVDVRTYRVIYDALNDVEAAIKGMLAPKFKEVVQGRVEVRQLITISKLLIAGCYVLEGKVTNSSKVRIVRDGIVLHEDVIESLRRFKDDVKEVAQGFECGITLEKYRDIKEGDVFEVYDMEEVAVE
ncbi:translation initiation factor IF-2, partial [uncultured Phascolarctobacterium sp.]